MKLVRVKKLKCQTPRGLMLKTPSHATMAFYLEHRWQFRRIKRTSPFLQKISEEELFRIRVGELKTYLRLELLVRKKRLIEFRRKARNLRLLRIYRKKVLKNIEE